MERDPELGLLCVRSGVPKDSDFIEFFRFAFLLHLLMIITKMINSSTIPRVTSKYTHHLFPLSSSLEEELPQGGILLVDLKSLPSLDVEFSCSDVDE